MNRENLNELFAKIAQTIIAVVIFYTVKIIKSTKQTHVIALSYILYEVINAVTSYKMISDRERDAESDDDYFAKNTF